ncbi:MAG: S-DNA-T family DNA segregation ATPase FtsK/SpoIIIE [Lentimonas sp.]|jgi:S-DNA-T family DNA segregation ATPase FtsK/SpoIIIE
MTKKTSKKVVAKKIVSQPRKVRVRPFVALVCFFLAICSLVAIGDFDISQSRQHTTEPETNLVGFLGAEGSFWTFYCIGIAAWLIPVYLLWAGVRFSMQQEPGKRTRSAIASIVSLVSASGLVSMLEFEKVLQAQGGIFERQLSQGLGGCVGELLINFVLQPYIGSFGSFLILLMALLVGSVIVFTNNLERLRTSVQYGFKRFIESRSKSKEMRKAIREQQLEAKRQAKAEVAIAKTQFKAERAIAKAKKNSRPDESSDSDPVPQVSGRPTLLPSSISSPSGLKRGKAVPKTMPAEPSVQVTPAEPAKPKFDPSMIKVVAEEKTEKAVASIPERRGDYIFPPIDLLAKPQAKQAMRSEDHAGTMEALVRTLDEFGVKVIPGEIHTGPVITRYEVTPAPGVRVEKIANLDKNIALGLKATSVRILAPVPGKGTVGIEVPNKVSEAVCMRDIVESKAWADAKAEIPIVLGKDVTGKPIVTDLTKMPHVLIAGSTGSGKTVCINAIIASLLYHSGPEDLRFIMVDPKVVEMQMYNALPHMLIPVVTEPKKVPGALKWLIAEMEHRYQIFAKTNVRNIAGFNAKLLKDKEEQAKAEAMDAEMSAEERAAVSNIEVPRDDDAFEIPKKKLPYIVCVIDELADLMMVAPADIETCIARLAQLARAAGIHLILATQRPSVNVITGVIKANLPSRISFKVASKIDSRTILDGGGAEALIGKGDMLFIPPGTSNLVRAQGAFVSDEEINAIVEFLQQKNEPPVFAAEVQRQIDAGDDEGSDIGAVGEDSDELLPDAIDVLRNTKRASTSMLQRRLRIGYNRAARLMEALEARGIVGPENGSSPREILVDLDLDVM